MEQRYSRSIRLSATLQSNSPKPQSWTTLPPPKLTALTMLQPLPTPPEVSLLGLLRATRQHRTSISAALSLARLLKTPPSFSQMDRAYIAPQSKRITPRLKRSSVAPSTILSTSAVLSSCARPRILIALLPAKLPQLICSVIRGVLSPLLKTSTSPGSKWCKGYWKSGTRPSVKGWKPKII